MVELQACTGLINASALCEIEQESKGESVNVILKISDELQRERKRNAELMERISFLEAKLVEERLKETQLGDGKGDCSKSRKRSFKRFKKSKEETENNPKIEKNERMVKHDTQCLPPKGENLDDRLVNWMSMDETQFMHYEKSKECDIIVDCVDTDDTHDEDYDYQEENDIRFEMKDCEINGSSRNFNDDKQHMYHDPDMRYLENHTAAQGKPTYLDDNTEAKECARSCSLPEISEPGSKSEKNEAESIELSNGIPNIVSSGTEVCGVGSRNISLQRKPPKLAFCPKEVKAIIKSEVLLLKNAQSHTMRKIIVFACLGIRHGCEEIYELDFNHFSILRKGEPYISPQTPGEHVLYENPGVRRKVFYPDRHNPTLCPVQILEEEKAMRPLDANCPSCLFLCIKYGGRTRNLPQNEYVRQRMGRNKLKSFGPLMCRLAMLVNIRCGSFFFKALGITLLFMSGCPDDLVRKETNYRNLDLLQKYYRTDKDAEGEELFLAHPTMDIKDKSVEEQLAGKKISKKAKRKKQSSTNKQPSASHKSAVQVQESSSSKQSGLVGYTSGQTHAMAAFQSLPSPSQTPVDHNHPIPNPMVASSCALASSQNQNPFNYFPPNPFVPMIYWPPPNSFNPGLYPPAYNYHSFPSAGNYISFQSQPYCSYPYSPFISKPLEKSAKTEDVSEETNSDSESSSSSKDQNTSTSCKQ